MLISPVSFTGNWTLIHPLNSIHREPLRRAAKNESIWTFTTYKATEEGFNPWFDETLRESERGNQLPFVIFSAAEKNIIGSIRYYNIEHKHQRLNIGHFWINPASNNTPARYEIFYMLMKHAIEVLNFRRIEITTDERNLPLHKILMEMGAVSESMLADHMNCHDGTIRTTRLFRILASEWPEVKIKLHTLINQTEPATI